MVTDTIRSGSDAVIREQNGVEVYEAKDGSNYSTYKVNDKAEKGTVTEGKKGFTYTFPEGSTGKSYRFIYYTTNPTLQAGKTTIVENDVTAERGDKKYTGEGKVTVEAREGLLIKAPRDKTLDVVDSTKLKKDWSIAVRTAAEMDAGKTFTIKDTFQTPKVNGSESTTLKHYAIKSRLDEQLKAGMNLYWVSGDQSNQESLSTVLNRFPGVSVTFKYYKEDETEALKDGDHVTSFKITVDWKNAKDQNLIITQLNADNYTSYIEDISSLKAGDTVKATNKIECEESKKPSTEATNSYTKPEPEKPKDSELRKLVATSGSPDDFDGKTATIQTGTPNGTVIWFKLLIKHPDPNADTVIITDTLPKGLKYEDFDGKARETGWKDSYYVGTTKNDRNGISAGDLWASTSQPDENVFKLESSMNGNGQQVLTFTLSGLKGKDLTNVDASIIYGVKVEDEYWNDISAKSPSKDYPNEAKWGELEKSATATVTRTNFETQKDVNYDQTTQTATYIVTINEQGKRLLPYEGGYLKLEDQLTVPPGLSATLDPNSIVVKDKDGKIVKDAQGECEIDPATHTMKIEIKDGAKYELSYTYKFVPDEDLASGYTLPVTNEVKMFGKIASNKSMEFHNGGGSGTAWNGVTDILTLVKSEKGKNNNTLGGVTFELSEYGESGWTSKGNHTTASEGDAKGTITFRYNENKNPAEGTVQVNADTLYKLVETKTADNYILDDTPHYFVMLSKNANADDVYQTFTGSGVAKNDIKFVSAGQMTDVLKVENEARKIKVEKVWKDADGNAMAAPQGSITVTLQRKVGNVVDNDFSEKLTLTQGNGWKVTYPDTGSLPETDRSGNLYYYFVTETEDSVPDGFSVMYSYVDKNGATQSEHGVTAGGTATITNQQKTNWLNVTKVWQDSDGKPLTENLPEITVHLYRRNADGTNTDMENSLTLKADNNWKGQFTDLEPDAQYYVVEETVDGYTVSYTSDVENPAVPGATITVTNCKNAPGYELPATGSTGTAPYTTAGVVLMGAALVGGYRRKRRQERRGE